MYLMVSSSFPAINPSPWVRKFVHLWWKSRTRIHSSTAKPKTITTHFRTPQEHEEETSETTKMGSKESREESGGEGAEEEGTERKRKEWEQS